MNFPTQAQAVQRQGQGHAMAAGGLLPSACGAANTGQGQCFDANGPIGGPGAFNCQACCALRGAIHWQGLNGTVAAC